MTLMIDEQTVKLYRILVITISSLLILFVRKLCSVCV